MPGNRRLRFFRHSQLPAWGVRRAGSSQASENGNRFLHPQPALNWEEIETIIVVVVAAVIAGVAAAAVIKANKSSKKK